MRALPAQGRQDAPHMVQACVQGISEAFLRAFVLSARLQQAHAMLLTAGDRMTLTEIATQSGVWHLGRFPRYYRDLFGCTPSEMQRRIWGRPVLERAA